MTTQTALCPVHVGRASETGALADRLTELVDTGAGRLVLVAGEAGLGKSRLATEARERARQLGLRALVGQCTPERAAPYGAFVTAVRRQIRTLDDQSIRDLFSGAAELSAVLLPEVSRLVPPGTTAPSAEDLFAAVWQLLYRVAWPSGAVLVIEDLHWADVDTLKLLTYLAREGTDLPVLVLGTYRPDEVHRRHPLSDVLAELGRARLVTEVRLSPLGREDLRAMLSAIFDGTEVGDEFVDAVFGRTAGNPFFVEELCKVLVDRGDVYRARGEWERRALADIAMPLTVRDTLLARVKALDPDTLLVLKLAALAGERLDLAVLADASGIGAVELDEAVGRGLETQLLVEQRSGPLIRYAFRHALTREALADELVGPDRRRAHEHLARAIVRTHAEDLDAVAGALADHFSQAGDVEEALEFSRRAAHVAMSRYAFDEGDRLYDRALHLLARDDPRRLEILIEAIDQDVRYDPTPMAVAFATEARDIARVADDPVAQARAIMLLQAASWRTGDTAGAIVQLREALALVQERFPDEEAIVLARLSRLLHFAGESEEAETLVERGLTVARASQNWSALSALHGTRMIVGAGPGFHEAFEEAIVAARRAKDPLRELNVLTNAGYISIWHGEFATSRDALARARELSTRVAPSDQYVAAGEAWLRSLTGEYPEAEDLARPLASTTSIPTRIVALTALYEVAERRGDDTSSELADALWDAAKSTGESQRSVPALAAQARRSLRDDGIEAAQALFWRAFEATVTSAGTGSHWMFSPDLAFALADQKMVAELERWTEATASLTERDPSRQNRAASSLCHALLLAARGDLDLSRRAFDEAVMNYESLPCPARVVEARLGRADVDVRAGRSADAMEEVHAALEVATRIGAGQLVAAAKNALDRMATEAVLATVLFTDIVGSTVRAAQLGDRQWRAELDKHNGLATREIARYGGRMIKSTGDGLLATFDSPARGVRCALELTRTLQAANIDIRSGLHTGEIVLSGDDIAGIAVHIGARVVSVAGPGEVLVSRTVADLAVGSGLHFTDRGEHELKGVPGTWRLFTVEG